MTKTKQWKWTLVALCAVLVLSLGAIGFSAIMQRQTTALAEDNVLQGNTAQYTFENDSQYPWTYNRAENVWTRQGTTKEESSTLTLRVTQDGTISLEYFIDSNYDGGLQISVSGSESKVILAQTYTATNEFKTLDSFAVKKDDVVTIAYKATWSSSAANYTQIKGLLYPDTKVNVTVEASENGQLSHGDVTQNRFENQQVLLEDTFDVEAKPSEGYIFAYWADQAGNIVSYNEVLDITHIKDNSYKAFFHKTGSVTTSFSQIGDKDTWKEVDGHYEADMSVIQSGQTGTLTIEFDGKGSGYYTFDTKVAVNWDENITVYLNGVEVFSDGSCNSNYNSVEQLQWEHQVLSLKGDGYHRLDFVYEDAGATPDSNAGRFDIVYVGNIHTPATDEEANLVEYEIAFNNNVGDVYAYMANNQPNASEFKKNGTLITPGIYKIAENCKIYFGIFPHTNYNSSIDPTQKTNSIFVGTYNKEGEKSGSNGLGGIDYYVWAQFSQDGKSAVGNLESSTRYIEIKMQEVAVAPQTISVSYKVNGESHEQEPIVNGQTYEVPYQSDNQFTVSVSDYTNAKEELKVTANGANVQTELVNGYFGFTLYDLIADTTISVQIEYGDYYASDPFLIYINMTLAGQEDIQKNLNPIGKVKIENDQSKPWVFSSTYSEGEKIAYMAGYSGAGQGEGNSSLKFTVTGSGTLTFDFYFIGYKNWQMVGYEFNKTLGNASSGGFQSGKTMVLGQGEEEAIIQSSDVVSSLKGDLGQGWFHAQIPVSTQTVGKDVNDNTEVVIYVAYGDDWGSCKYDVMAIRNVMYLQGESTANFKVVDDKQQEASAKGSIEAKNGQDTVSSGDTVQMGDKLTLTATPQDGNSFYAWRDSSTKDVISYDKSITLTVVGDVNVEAVIAPTGTYKARIDDTFYNTLNAALSEASSGGKTVVIVDNVEISGDLTIEKGVKLVLPFNGDGDYYAEGNKTNATNRVSWGTEQLESKYLFRKITISGKITVNGEFYIGGVLHYPDQSAQGHTSGAYSQLVLDGSIEVCDGGVLDVCGRVTGTGMITVKAGGKILQPFLILDFSGGTNTSGLYGLNQTPFNRYSVINVQCEQGLKIEYKGEFWGHASLYAIGGINSMDAPIISYSDGTEEEPRGFITLTDGGSVTAIYHDEKKISKPSNAASNNTIDVGYTELIFDSTKPTGGAIANSLTMTYMVVTISTANVVGFSIPYNYQITLKSGQYTLDGNFKLMPGSSLTIEENATLTVGKGKNLLVYDGLIQTTMSGKGYPSADDLTTAGYKTNGTLIVNGTLNINSKATLLGAVQSTVANATIVIAEDAILTGSIIDGGVTSYDCTYAEYSSSARVYDAAHDVIAVLQPGRTYKSLTTEKPWTLQDITTTYEPSNFGSAEKMKGHTHSLATGTLSTVTDLQGSWKVEHGSSHVYDWTLSDDDDKPTADKKHTELERQCTELGCNEIGHTQLLWVPESIGDLTYDGEDVTEEDINGLLNSLYGDLSLEPSFEGLNARNAKNGYTVTVTLSNGLWLVKNAGVKSDQLSFNVKQKKITVTPTEQTFEYGQEVRLSQTAYTAVTCGDDVLELSLKIQGDVAPHNAGDYIIEVVLGSNPNYSITPATGTCKVTKLSITVTMPSKTRDYDGKVPDVGDLTKPTADKALGYQDKIEDLVTMTIQNAAKDAATYVVHGTATEQSKTNYEITVTDGSYTVTPKNVTVKADPKESVYGKDIEQLTYKIPDLVAGDNLDEYISITTNATNASPVGSSYVITVTWEDERNKPQNYEVQFENATYTITEAAFEGISFGNGNFTYDGTVHNITVTGAPDGAQVEYKCKEQKFDGAKNVGTYEITATVSLANYNNQDYHATLTISARKVTVNLPEYSREYNGKVPQISDIEALLSIADTSENSTLGEGDNLSEIVTLTIVGAAKDVKDYTVTGKCNNDNYTIDFVKDGVYKVVPAEITVKVLPQSKTYDGNEAEAKSDSEYWQITAGAEKVVSDDDKPFGVTLTLDGKSSYKNVGFYNIKGECTNDNYRVTFTDETNAYEIKARTLTVTARPQQSVYGEQVVTKLDYDIDGKIDDGTTVDVSVTCEVEAGSHYRQEGYEITVTVTNKESLTNYNVVEVNGVYTVTKRPVKVTIQPQTDVYGFGKTTYDWNDDLWTAEENSPASGLASGESKEVLGVTLTQPHITGAGSYPIVATASNNDYQVTFEGEWHSDDANNGKAGVYTVSKLTLTDGEEETVFNLYVDGEPFNTQMPQRYPYVNKALMLTADVSVWEGDNYREQPLDATVSPSTLEELGVHVVTVTIDDDNYCGTCTFNVEVVRADGYSQTLLKVLSNLEELAGSLSADTITATQENYAAVKGIVTELNKLSNEDKRVGEEELAPYIEIVEAWDSAANIDDGVIETAQAIADAPLKGLFAIAALNALVAAAYVIAKGGIL